MGARGSRPVYLVSPALFNTELEAEDQRGHGHSLMHIGR